MNRLSEYTSDLIPVDLTEILQHLVHTLQRTSLFRLNTERRFVRIEADSIATMVAAEAHRFRHPLGSAAHLAQMASVHFGPHRERTEQVLQLLAQTVRNQLTSIIAEKTGEDAGTLLRSWLLPLATLTGPCVTPGFHYQFDTIKATQQLQRLTTSPARTARGVLDSHHVTVTLADSATFTQTLATGIRHAFAAQFPHADPGDVAEFEAVLAEQMRGQSSDLHRVSQAVMSLSLSVIKREVQMRYLEYLRDTLGTSGGAVFLADLVRRLRLLDSYMLDSERPDGDFMVSYAGSRPINYRDMFQQATAFDLLPIVPIIDGTLSTIADQPRGERVWTFGIKLKLDGPVYRVGANAPRVFAYYLDQLSPDSPGHIARRAAGADDARFPPRVLQLAALYTIVFTEFGNLAYDPIAYFDQAVLPILRGTDEPAKISLLRRIVLKLSQPGVTTALHSLRRWLQQQLRTHTSFPRQPYLADLALTRTILEHDIERIVLERTPFRDLDAEGRTIRRALVLGDPQINAAALAHLPVRLAVHVQRYTPVEGETQTFDLAYAESNLPILPVLIAPRTRSQSLYTAYFEKYPLITIPYTSTALDAMVEDRVDGQAFVTRLAYAVLSYLGLRALLELLPERPFIPILRLHDGAAENGPNGQAGEAAIAVISKVLAHTLSTDTPASTQGLNVAELLSSAAGATSAVRSPAWRYKLLNGLSSLYAPLPKHIAFDTAVVSEAERIAIVVVGSRSADRSREGTVQLTNLYGEAIGVIHTSTQVTVQTERTFAATDTVERLRSEPTVLMDLIQQLGAAGYRHIIYMAQAPAPTTMLGSMNEQDNLFWLEPSIVAALRRASPDVTLYPIFFDSYRALKRRGYRAGAHAYDIHDPKELQSLLTDPNRQAVVFYALFNGQQVGADPEGQLYNGVVTYATLLNRYGDVLDDRELHLGLLADGPRKTILLRSLLAVHYARYEAAVRRGVSLKLNPYSGIIGDHALGGFGNIPHLSGSARFNLLAFLSEVRTILGSPASMSG